ncbi:unnamed protein product [Clonostachys rosea]|uniref:Tyrosinase copper-binding domain-containing protein n=1 Tax=Bionectria ochroleuca TaxID=29856 RepID=A0ABY6U842_BIOOC|nr:unnamed protein product [Clonostachys rosea]
MRFSGVRSVWTALTVALLATCVSADSAEADAVAGRCRKPIVRREWRTLSVQNRQKYLQSLKCLMKKPPQTSKDVIPGVRSRYDDFLGTHIVNADSVHFVGVFYPYHRLLLHAFEEELSTCGWKDGIPYWDWTKDAPGLDNVTDVFFNSPIFDTKHGFGGNGPWIPGNFDNPAPGQTVNTPWDVPDRTGGGCIQDGPFAGLQTNLGPGNGTAYNPHCVQRDFAPLTFASMSGPLAVLTGLALPNFGWFDRVTESSFHAGGHWAVGGLYGTMTDKWASRKYPEPLHFSFTRAAWTNISELAADPIFWSHHANLDRAWWSWQKRNLRKRLTDVSGPLVNFDWTNQLGGNITLDHTITVFETVKVQAKVRDVMHIQQGPLCYEYDQLY